MDLPAPDCPITTVVVPLWNSAVIPRRAETGPLADWYTWTKPTQAAAGRRDAVSGDTAKDLREGGSGAGPLHEGDDQQDDEPYRGCARSHIGELKTQENGGRCCGERIEVAEHELQGESRQEDAEDQTCDGHGGHFECGGHDRRSPGETHPFGQGCAEAAPIGVRSEIEAEPAESHEYTGEADDLEVPERPELGSRVVCFKRSAATNPDRTGIASLPSWADTAVSVLLIQSSDASVIP